MKRWRRVVIILLLAAALVVGFLLPTFVARLQDTQSDQTQAVVSANRVQLDMGSTLTVLQRLRIVADRTGAVELDSAQTLGEEQALEELQRGLEILFSSGLTGISISADHFSEVSHSIYLKLSDESSMIYWEFWLADGEGNQIIAQVDDDTGLILSLSLTMNPDAGKEESEETFPWPAKPLFLLEEIPMDTGRSFSSNGIFEGLEETGDSVEDLLVELQERYCGEYLSGRGYELEWETGASEPVDNSYRYSVMVVDDAGGYYVLPFSATNNEIDIN